MKCTLVENAVDYLLLAGDQIGNGNLRLLKHGIANLYDGIELLLKARLELEHWSLVFWDADKANRQAYESGDFRSVDFQQSIARLKGICGVSISDSQQRFLNQLRQLRNRIRHFSVPADEPAATSLAARTYSFALAFFAAELEGGMTEEVLEAFDALRRLLSTVEHFVTLRMEEIQPEIDKQKLCEFVMCPMCLRDMLFAKDGIATCLFCSLRDDGEVVAGIWARTVTPHPSDPIPHECEVCGRNACLWVEQDILHHYCFSCGQTNNVGHKGDRIPFGELTEEQLLEIYTSE